MTRIPPLKHEWDCASCASLEAEIARLRQTLHEIDAIAIRKEAGAAVKMQKVARAALKEPTP